MKGIPEIVGENLALWMQRVNALAEQANKIERIHGSADSLKNLLGEPDEIKVVPTANRISDEAGETDEREPEEYWLWLDPTRPQRRYVYGISRGKVVLASRSTYQ